MATFNITNTAIIGQREAVERCMKQQGIDILDQITNGESFK